MPEISESAENRILLERVLTTLDMHTKEQALLRDEVRALTIKVAEIRIGWKVVAGVGTAVIALGTVLAAVWRRGGPGP